METVHERIMKHRKLYENAGLEVPPYRLTGIEHRRLKQFCGWINLDRAEPQKEYEFITNYMGVSIEHVIKLTEY